MILIKLGKGERLTKMIMPDIAINTENTFGNIYGAPSFAGIANNKCQSPGILHSADIL